MKKLGIFFAALVFSVTASANLVFSPGLGYYSDTQEATTPAALNSEETETRADMRLGYILPMGLYVGGMYSYSSFDFGASDSSGFLVGPTIGYHSRMGFYTLFTYYIMGEQGDTNKFTGGKGPQLDLGWVFPISSFMAIGPQLTWRSIEFDSFENSGVSQDTDLKQTTIAPYISLWFMF